VIILERLPISDRPHLFSVQGEPVEIYRNQVVIWVSIADAVRPIAADFILFAAMNAWPCGYQSCFPKGLAA
jgi:hypothetical protein